MFVSPTPESVSVPGLFSVTSTSQQASASLSYFFDHIDDFAEHTNFNSSSSASMFEHAVTAAAKLISSHRVGGRIVALASSGASIPAPRETETINPLTTTYRTLGKLCAKDSIGVDLFLFAPSSQVQRRQQDIPTLGELVRVTGGQFYYYRYGSNNNWTFNADLRRNLTRSWGCNAVLKVRAGKGIYPEEYLGNFLPMGGNSKTKCASFAIIDSDKAVGVTFAHDNNSKNPVTGNVVFQTALMYTNGTNGALSVRVHTIVAPSSSIISTIFRSFDCDALIGLLARKAVNSMRWSGTSPERASDDLAKSTSSSLTVYRFSCTRNPVVGNLVLPDTLSLLPLYVSCLMKSPLLTDGIHPDLRSSVMYAIASMTPRDMLISLYPRVFFLDSVLPPDDKKECISDGDDCPLPRAIRPTIDTYNIDGVYLIDNGGSTVHIFVGDSPDPDIAEHLFGTRDISTLSSLALTDAFSVKLQQWMADSDGMNDTETMIRYPVFSIVQELARVRGHNCFGFEVVRDADVKNDCVLWSQVYAEDSLKKSPSYANFLCSVHKRINNNILQMNH